MYLLCVFIQKDSIQFQLSSGPKSLENWAVKMFSIQSVLVSVGFFPFEEKEGCWILTSQTSALMFHVYNWLYSMDDYYYYYYIIIVVVVAAVVIDQLDQEMVSGQA